MAPGYLHGISAGRKGRRSRSVYGPVSTPWWQSEPYGLVVFLQPGSLRAGPPPHHHPTGRRAKPVGERWAALHPLRRLPDGGVGRSRQANLSCDHRQVGHRRELDGRLRRRSPGPEIPSSLLLHLVSLRWVLDGEYTRRTLVLVRQSQRPRLLCPDRWPGRADDAATLVRLRHRGPPARREPALSCLSRRAWNSSYLS